MGVWNPAKHFQSPKRMYEADHIITKHYEIDVFGIHKRERESTAGKPDESASSTKLHYKTDMFYHLGYPQGIKPVIATPS